MTPSRDISRLIEIMAALRTPKTGCPWDLEQNFATIAPYTLEEAYEVADAIARNDLDDLTKLYYSRAVLLPADGSRAEGQSEIRASLQKQIGSKVEVRSLGPACSGDLAYENGTYTQLKMANPSRATIS